VAGTVVVGTNVEAVEVLVVPADAVLVLAGATVVDVARLEVVVEPAGSSSLATRNTTVPTTTTKRPDKIQAVRFLANPPVLGDSDTGRQVTRRLVF
jgi:hypothetical protein